jgi:ABC-2 type transport system ATP-binding protein
MAEPAIRTWNLTKYYGKHRGIEGLDLEVGKGEIFGFIGPNGAGKTTTIRTLLGLIFPTSGGAEIFGRDVVRQGPRARENIGYVPAEVRYYPGMTVREVFRYAGALHGIQDLSRAWSLSERLGLDVSRKAEDLSTGNARKAAIVQALLHSPRLLILDEPTSGLDPLVQQSFSAILAEETAGGATVFLSSHVLSEVQQLCRRVAIVKDGRLVACEDIATLQQKHLRRVAIASHRALGPADFPSGHATEFSREADTVRFLYAGDGTTLVRELARFDIRDLLVEEPTLEEIFLHFYRTETPA